MIFKGCSVRMGGLFGTIWILSRNSSSIYLGLFTSSWWLPSNSPSKLISNRSCTSIANWISSSEHHQNPHGVCHHHGPAHPIFSAQNFDYPLSYARDQFWVTRSHTGHTPLINVGFVLRENLCMRRLVSLFQTRMLPSENPANTSLLSHCKHVTAGMPAKSLSFVWQLRSELSYTLYSAHQPKSISRCLHVHGPVSDTDNLLHLNTFSHFNDLWVSDSFVSSLIYLTI